jgi:hypothetical protein
MRVHVIMANDVGIFGLKKSPLEARLNKLRENHIGGESHWNMAKQIRHGFAVMGSADGLG